MIAVIYCAGHRDRPNRTDVRRASGIGVGAVEVDTACRYRVEVGCGNGCDGRIIYLRGISCSYCAIDIKRSAVGSEAYSISECDIVAAIAVWQVSITVAAQQAAHCAHARKIIFRQHRAG